MNAYGRVVMKAVPVLDAETERAVRGLLAVIHGDDGEHAETYGLAESCRQAAAVVNLDRTRRDGAESRWERFHGMIRDNVGF